MGGAEEEERGGKHETEGGKAGRKRKMEKAEGEEGAKGGGDSAFKTPVKMWQNTAESPITWYEYPKSGMNMVQLLKI